MRHLFTSLLLLAFFYTGLAQSSFYTVDKIQEIKIEFEADNWRYLLDSLRYNGEELQPATIKINGQKLDNAGVRYRDGRSFTPNGRRNGLFIDLGDHNIEGHRIINLSSALRDPSMIREVLASEIAAAYFPTPRANFAKVYINEDYYGIFVNVETVGKGFLDYAFNENKGDLSFAKNHTNDIVDDGCGKKIAGSLQYEKKSSCLNDNFDALQGNLGGIQQLCQKLADNDDTYDNILNIDATLWMLAFNNVIVNLYSYSGQFAQNYYLYQNSNGQLQPILGELNLSFGSYKNDGIHASDLKTPELLMLDPMLHSDNEYRPLISKLLANDSYRLQYRAHLRTILLEQILSGRLENRALELQNMIRTAVAMDTGKYYTSEEFGQSLSKTIGKHSRIPGLVDFMNKRGNWLEKESVYTFLPSIVSDVGIRGRERFSSTLVNEFRVHATVSNFPKKVFVYYRFSSMDDFNVMEMTDDGEHFDEKANDGIFGAIIMPKEGQIAIQYYILAENAKAATFSPSKYNFEQYSSSLTEVNR